MLKILWTSWCCLTALGTAWLFVALPDDGGGGGAPDSNSTVFLPGQTTHGHHQIEMNCSVCHLPDGGVTDQSCIDCHKEDLDESRDTHPAKKFVDPTRAVLLAKLDAQNCLSCHIEHQEERTHAMGVTVPQDFCWHCHEDIAKDRPSHAEMDFNSCTNVGCHNYHDNSALYENFLRKHSGERSLHAAALNPLRKFERWLAEDGGTATVSLSSADANAPVDWENAGIAEQWSQSAHAIKGVNCSGCHLSDEASTGDASGWVSAPDHQSCAECHDVEVNGFRKGKHGMRQTVSLGPMTPELARLPMHADAAHRSLDCSACHDPHKPDLHLAAFDACLKCHDDEHSRSYKNSTHFALWQAELRGKADAGSGVSCATCHMPRDAEGFVDHNQNDNLRPIEKMVRTVCMNCHGLQFTLDALADPELKLNCYSTTPKQSVRSLQMVTEWFELKKK